MIGKNVKHIALLIALLITVAVLISGCSPKNQLVGHWAQDIQGNWPYSMILYEDGRANFDGIPGTWHTNNNKLYINFTLGEKEYDYHISNNKLYVKEEYSVGEYLEDIYTKQ